MIEYRINKNKFSKTMVDLPVSVEDITTIDFEEIDNENNGDNSDVTEDQLVLVCECSDIDKLHAGDTITTVNELSLQYALGEDYQYSNNYTFNNEYRINGINEDERSFSFVIDKYYPLEVESINRKVYKNACDIQNKYDKVFVKFKSNHFFDYYDVLNNKIKLYFKYFDSSGALQTKTIENIIEFVDYQTLSIDYDDGEDLWRIIFDDTSFYVNKDDELDIISYGIYNDRTLFSKEDYEYDEENNEYKNICVTTGDSIGSDDYKVISVNGKNHYIMVQIGDFGGIDVFRDRFLFTERTTYTFTFVRPIVNINIPITNTFETNLLQMDLLNEHFVEAEKKKAINSIVDVEKDVYYPSIAVLNNGSQTVDYKDVYTIKFNLHFREHRGDDWLVEHKSYWNGCERTDGSIKSSVSKEDGTSSDLLTFLNFNNDDVHYQKNRLKKSFLRLSFYDSTNPADQNLLAYSTVFFDTGDMFSKYIRYMEEDGYVQISYNEYGVYHVDDEKKKIGIRVNREHDFDEEKRLSSQFVIKDKNRSKASSDGFYLYLWKDNESALPQDIYMKVEFNHAGFGRTVPFMMPYWDKRKWPNDERGFKSFKEIVEDFDSVKHDGVYKYNNNKETDGPYGIRQYNKYSYLHLKYLYDINDMKHKYYIDYETYGEQDSVGNEIVINLYEAKIGGGKNEDD